MNTIDIDSNKLIAFFMGWKPSVENYHGINLYYLPNDETGHYNYKCKQMAVSDMKYHNSWDWIMEVIDKIESLKMNTSTELFWFEINAGFIILHSHPQYHEETTTIEVKVTNTKLEAVYKAVVIFINWYNEKIKSIKSIN